MWKDFALFGEADKFFAMQTARQRMMDFSIIQNHGQRFTPEDAIWLHTASRDWLAAMLAEPCDGKTVVITHHAPSSQSVHPGYARGLLTPAFASNLENLMEAAHVGNPEIKSFCKACMDGVYPTGDVDEAMLHDIESERLKSHQAIENE